MTMDLPEKIVIRGGSVFLCCITILLSMCAIVMYQYDGIIKGRVELEDKPPGGNGGVEVYTNTMSIYTLPDGSFELEGSITRGGKVTVHFKKEGYQGISYELKFDNFEYSEEEDMSVCDLGVVNLEKSVSASVSADFNDGDSEGWIEDEQASYRVENGEYSIESPDDDQQHWALHNFEPNGDFSMRTKVEYISGSINSPYGIGVFDINNERTCLLISKSGWYEVASYKDSWHEIQGWTQLSVIDSSAGSANNLKMRYNSGTLTVSINGTEVNSYSDTDLNEVARIGLYVQDDLHVHFDNVEAKRL